LTRGWGRALSHAREWARAHRNLTWGVEDVEHTMCLHPAQRLIEAMGRGLYQNMLHPPQEQLTNAHDLMGESWRGTGEVWHPWFHAADDRYV
jgi:hypothetical protein